MAGSRTNYAHGMTLIEVLIAALVVSVAATGVLSYGYHGARQRRMAQAHARATEVGYFLLEDWKANGGSIFYARAVAGTPNPLELDMGFEYVEMAHKVGGRIECIYELTVDTIPMRVSLTRPTGYLRLIPLEVTVRWRSDLSGGPVDKGDQSVVKLTTDVRIDQAGG
jgi:prepilin-type N-terminal cleavage/methylation domain-containing protein